MIFFVFFQKEAIDEKGILVHFNVLIRSGLYRFHGRMYVHVRISKGRHDADRDVKGTADVKRCFAV
jgi:hypothetical protein